MNDKLTNKNSNVLVIVLIIVAILCVLFNDKFPSFDKKTDIVYKQVQKEITKKSISPIETSGIIDIKYNHPAELSFKSKNEIFDIRRLAVKNSIFKGEYTPSEVVFGSIVDGKPWVANNICKDPQTAAMRYDGPSEEGRFISNPSILVALEYPFSYSAYPDETWCKESVNNLLPEKVQYDGDKNEILVTYTRLPFSNNDGFSFYQFNGINARDLGYRYAYVDVSKSSYDLDFLDSDNISNRIIEFQNFIHLGFSCKVEGGCNNGSPRQSYLEFRQLNPSFENYNGEIYIKLWKDYPTSETSPPDIVEKIVIKEY